MKIEEARERVTNWLIHFDYWFLIGWNAALFPQSFRDCDWIEKSSHVRSVVFNNRKKWILGSRAKTRKNYNSKTRSLHSLVRYCVCHENKKFMSLSQHVMFFSLYRQKLENQIKGKTVRELQLGCWNTLNIFPLVYLEENPWIDEIYFFILAFLAFSFSLVNHFMTNSVN